MTKPAEEEEGPDAARISAIAAGALGVLFSLAALVLFSGRTAFSVAVGTVLAVLNLVALSAILRAILRPPADDEEENAAETPAESRAAGKRGGAAWGGFAVLKMVFLFGGVWILLTRGLVDPIPLVVGYGTLPLGITVSGLLISMMPRRRKRDKRG